MNYKKLLRSTFKSFRKKHLVEISVVVLLLIVISAYKVFSDHFSAQGDPTKLATLAINFENQKRYFEGEVFEGMTALDAMNMALGVGKVKLNYVLDEKNQTWFMEINGHTLMSDKQFTFYLNDKKLDSRNLNKVTIEAGDSMVIKYE